MEDGKPERERFTKLKAISLSVKDLRNGKR